MTRHRGAVVRPVHALVRCPRAQSIDVRQAFPERNVPIVAPDDRTIEMWRVTLGYRLAAPPARCPAPRSGHRHHGPNGGVAGLRPFGHGRPHGPATHSARPVDAPARVRWPSAVHMAAATEPAQTFSPTLEVTPALAAAINVDLASFMSVVSPNSAISGNCLSYNPL